MEDARDVLAAAMARVEAMQREADRRRAVVTLARDAVDHATRRGVFCEIALAGDDLTLTYRPWLDYGAAPEGDIALVEPLGEDGWDQGLLDDLQVVAEVDGDLVLPVFVPEPEPAPAMVAAVVSDVSPEPVTASPAPVTVVAVPVDGVADPVAPPAAPPVDLPGDMRPAGVIVPWTEGETLTVVSLAGTMPVAQVADKVGRSPRAVEQYLTKLRNGTKPMPDGWRVTADRQFVPVPDDVPAPAAARAQPVEEIAPAGTLPPAAGDGPGGGAAATARIEPEPAPDSLTEPEPEVVPDAGPAAFAAAPQDALTAHLLGLSRKDWTFEADSELAELIGLGWTMQTIAVEMKRGANAVRDRFDLMTGLDRDTRTRAFGQKDIVARMALLSGLAYGVAA